MSPRVRGCRRQCRAEVEFLEGYSLRAGLRACRSGFHLLRADDRADQCPGQRRGTRARGAWSAVSRRVPGLDLRHAVKRSSRGRPMIRRLTLALVERWRSEAALAGCGASALPSATGEREHRVHAPRHRIRAAVTTAEQRVRRTPGSPLRTPRLVRVAPTAYGAALVRSSRVCAVPVHPRHEGREHLLRSVRDRLAALPRPAQAGARLR